jgi:hypothetical protein
VTLCTISYGGGVQSTAMLVLATQGRLGYTPDAALFANVGDDSEHPASLDYVRDIATPWAAERGLAVHEIKRTRRDGTPFKSLMTTMLEHDNPDVAREVIPVRGENGAPLSRVCTEDWKIRTVAKWQKQHGATKDDPAITLIGISTDEATRANRNNNIKTQVIEYPLLDLGMNRSMCEQVIKDAGLPVPPKSSCYFCPFHRPQVWQEMRRDEPDLFEKSAQLEDLLNGRRERLGKKRVWLTGFGIPLREAITEAQDELPFGDDAAYDCGGSCWT